MEHTLPKKTPFPKTPKPQIMLKKIKLVISIFIIMKIASVINDFNPKSIQSCSSMTRSYLYIVIWNTKYIGLLICLVLKFKSVPCH